MGEGFNQILMTCWKRAMEQDPPKARKAKVCACYYIHIMCVCVCMCVCVYTRGLEMSYYI